MGIIIASLLAVLSGPALQKSVPAQGAAAPPSSSEWMSEDDDVPELKLAHEEKDRPDGGILRVDSRKRTVLWEGIPDETGCKRRVEVSFDDVKGISVSDLAGFVIEFKTGKDRKLVLIPVPHAWWFVQQWATGGGNFARNLPEGTLRDHDGAGLTVTGAEGGVGPRVRHRDIPKEVVKDTTTAANAVLGLLGRKRLR